MNKPNKIKPVLTLYGTKYKQIDKIINKFGNLDSSSFFFDGFGGTGIVGVNVKSQIGCTVWINDYDNLLTNFSFEKAVYNILKYNGIDGVTKARRQYLETRLKNGYRDKVEKYNEILKQCHLISHDFLNSVTFYLVEYIIKFYGNGDKFPTHIYLDPPYFNKKCYEHNFSYVDHENLFIAIKQMLGYCRDDIIAVPKILISYDDCPEIRNIWKDWQIVGDSWRYNSTRQNGKNIIGKEIWISNFEQGDK